VAVVEGSAVQKVGDALTRRYSGDYTVFCTSSADDGLRELSDRRAAGAVVALVIGDRWRPDREQQAPLARARELHPLAKRVLLIEWGAWRDPQTTAEVREAMATASIDYYAIVPQSPRDEDFHRLISELLQEWWRAHQPAAAEATLIGREGTQRVHELRSVLASSGVPFRFLEHGTAAAATLLSERGRFEAERDVPLLAVRDGQLLRDPSDAELARAFGVQTAVDTSEPFDVTIIGAGPAGLTSAVYAASEGLATLIIDRHGIGGQAATSSLIRNYLGFSKGISGGELAQRAYQQAWVFGAQFALMREVTALDRDEASGLWRIALDGGAAARTRAVILATGIAYRRLCGPGLERLLGSGVYYGASIWEARMMRGKRALVVGGGNSAGQAALHLSRYADSVDVIVRGDTLAASMSSYLREALQATASISIRYDTEVVDGDGSGSLQTITLRRRSTGKLLRLQAGGLFLMIGAEPRTDWLPAELERDEQGYLLTGADLIRGGRVVRSWPLHRAPHTLETSLPGVFAVGDVRHGSTKRVAAGAGEGSVAISELHRLLAGSAG
jgi:thioredoxin reductase (NADPH)